MVLLCCPWSYLNDELRWGRVGDLSSYERSVPGVQLDGMIPYPTCNQFGDDNADAKNYSRKRYWLLLYFGMRMTTLRGVCRVVEILSWLLIDDTILWRDGSDRILPWYPSQSPTLWVNNVGCSRWRCTVIGTSICFRICHRWFIHHNERRQRLCRWTTTLSRRSLFEIQYLQQSSYNATRQRQCLWE
jgi:hypothetical protein